MHVYAFGSVCRGEIDRDSDVDLLVLLDGDDARFSPNRFSIYSYGRVRALWSEGSPFGWHLHLEARLLFAGDGVDFLERLGRPADYVRSPADCAKFLALYYGAVEALPKSRSVVFELSTMFLAIRNIATCYALGRDMPIFSRDAARRLGVDSLVVESRVYTTLESARMISSRGLGVPPSKTELDAVKAAIPAMTEWMERIHSKVVS